MTKEKRVFVLGLVTFLCSSVVVVLSAMTWRGDFSRAQVLGLVAGSFGAGASLVNVVRDYVRQRGKG